MSQACGRYMSVRTVWHNLRAARHRTNHIRHLVSVAIFGGQAHFAYRNRMLGECFAIPSHRLVRRNNFGHLFAGDFVGHQRRHGCMRVPIDATKARIFAILCVVRAHSEHNQCCVTGIRPNQGVIRPT